MKKLIGLSFFSISLAVAAPAPKAAPNGTTKGGIPKLNLGSYVELDESIKGEPFEATLNFPDADLTELVKSISKWANKNFILDNSLKGKRISVMSPASVTKEEAYNLFLTALFMNGMTVVASGKYLRVIPSRDAPKSNVRVFYGDFVPASDEIVTLVYPLKNISSEDMPRIFQDLLPRSGSILVYPETNSVVMTDSGLNLRRMVSILKSVDVPGSQPKLESIPINYASAKDIAKMIEEILAAQSTGTSRITSSRLQKAQKISGGGVITKIVPDDRTNSLVVLANGKGIDQLRSLIAKLDTANASSEGNIHVYFVKNAVAEDLAKTLNDLLSGQSSSSSVPIREAGPNQPGVPRTAPTRIMDAEGVALEGQIKVVADKPTNSLIVRATGSNYESLKKILDRLDIPRRQVNVEATIMEIKITDHDNLSVGVNAALSGVAQVGGFIPSTINVDQFKSIVNTPAALQGLVAGLPAGNPVTLQGSNPEIKIPSFLGLIQAIQDLSLGQVLQQPNILTSDNEPGVVNITDKIKTQGNQQTQLGANGQPLISNSFDTVEVVLELKVTPQIGEDNSLVKLKVEQKMTDFSPSSSLAGQIDTTQRSTNTTVVVKDGETVVIGGLEKNDVKASKSKIPLLGDLPILGTLFRGTDTKKIRSNLMLFLTPRIIKSNGDLLGFTDMKLRKRQKDGQDAYDPKDFHKKEVHAMLVETDDRLRGKRGWGFRTVNPGAAPAVPAPEEESPKTSPPIEQAPLNNEEIVPEQPTTPAKKAPEPKQAEPVQKQKPAPTVQKPEPPPAPAKPEQPLEDEPLELLPSSGENSGTTTAPPKSNEALPPPSDLEDLNDSSLQDLDVK